MRTPFILPKDKAEALTSSLAFDKAELLPAIAREAQSGTLLMQAWMNRDAVLHTLQTGQAWYYSRSRNASWRKGESSGHTQTVTAFATDCDFDTILLDVIQQGPACHTNRPHCFFHLATGEGEWLVTEVPCD